jgi:hypothetical protein
LIIDPQKQYIGLGHSLGFTTLSQSTINFDIIVGLQCFCNFLGQDEKLYKIRKPKLDQMLNSFNINPKACLERFYNICGYNEKLENNLDITDLSTDLQMLYNSFIPRSLPTLIIGGTSDKIVPKSLIEDNFRNCDNMIIKYLPFAGHTLGYDLSDKIIEIITSFIHDQKISHRN